MWVRGLKQKEKIQRKHPRESHPMWVRGLKLRCDSFSLNTLSVAPYVGAWIETRRSSEDRLSVIVAPYVGAWIETRQDAHLQQGTLSHPMWVRGLKLVTALTALIRCRRTLCGCVD